MPKPSTEQVIHFTQEWANRALTEHNLSPRANRPERRFRDTQLEAFRARLSPAGALIFYVKTSELDKASGKRRWIEHSWGTLSGDFSVGDARTMHQTFIEHWRGAQQLSAELAIEAARGQRNRKGHALSMRAALDAHGKYLFEHKDSPGLASEARRWWKRRKHIERALDGVLDRPLSALSPERLIAGLRKRYHEQGSRKAVYNDLCDLRNIMKRNFLTQLFPASLVSFVLGHELRLEFAMPAAVRDGRSLRQADPAQFRKAWQFILDNARNGYLCTHAAAIMMGQHQAEIAAMRGDWIKTVDGARVCHFPGWIMKGRHQLDASVSSFKDNHVVVSPRLWALILAHREAIGVPLDAGPIWLAPGKSKRLPKQQIKDEPSTHLRLYKKVCEVSGLEDWGQLLFRRTFVSAAFAGGASALGIEVTLNHKLKSVTKHHYMDPGKLASLQTAASLEAVTLVEAWLAKMLGETGDNVTSLDGVSKNRS